MTRRPVRRSGSPPCLPDPRQPFRWPTFIRTSPISCTQRVVRRAVALSLSHGRSRLRLLLGPGVVAPAREAAAEAVLGVGLRLPPANRSRVSLNWIPHPALRATFSRWEKDTLAGFSFSLREKEARSAG